MRLYYSGNHVNFRLYFILLRVLLERVPDCVSVKVERINEHVPNTFSVRLFLSSTVFIREYLPFLMQDGLDFQVNG